MKEDPAPYKNLIIAAICDAMMDIVRRTKKINYNAVNEAHRYAYHWNEALRFFQKKDCMFEAYCDMIDIDPIPYRRMANKFSRMTDKQLAKQRDLIKQRVEAMRLSSQSNSKTIYELG